MKDFYNRNYDGGKIGFLRRKKNDIGTKSEASGTSSRNRTDREKNEELRNAM